MQNTVSSDIAVGQWLKFRHSEDEPLPPIKPHIVPWDKVLFLSLGVIALTAVMMFFIALTLHSRVKKDAARLDNTQWTISGGITKSGNRITFTLTPIAEVNRLEPVTFTLPTEHPSALYIERDYRSGNIVTVQYSEEELYNRGVAFCPPDNHLRFRMGTPPRVSYWPLAACAPTNRQPPHWLSFCLPWFFPRQMIL